MTQLYPIGTRFIPRSEQGRGKQRRVYEVVDYHVTTNLAGEVVKRRYVCQHEFCGQKIRDCDVVETTIAMGMMVNI